MVSLFNMDTKREKGFGKKEGKTSVVNSISLTR